MLRGLRQIADGRDRLGGGQSFAQTLDGCLAGIAAGQERGEFDQFICQFACRGRILLTGGLRPPCGATTWLPLIGSPSD
jgi:hypothetical protein